MFNDTEQAVTTPIMEPKKTAMIGVRATEAERQAWEDAARLDGRSLSAWIVRRCNGEPTTAPALAPRKPKRKPPTK